jgi:hypothetical protein
MSRRATSRVLMSSALFMLVMMGWDVSAQTATHPSAIGTSPQTQTSRTGQNHAAAEGNPACQRILSECKRLGFIQGQYKQDNGLWKDCFDPVVKGGGSPTRDGKTIHVPVSASDVQACRAAESHHKQVQ